MTARPCLGCGRPTSRPGGRCDECQPAHRAMVNRRHGSPAERGYDAAYLRLRRELVTEHLAAYGLVCPGWHLAAHPVPTERHLTLDHIVPLSKGGATTRENGRVLCMSCNRRRQARHD